MVDIEIVVKAFAFKKACLAVRDRFMLGYSVEQDPDELRAEFQEFRAWAEMQVQFEDVAGTEVGSHG